MSHVLRVGVADQIAYFRAYNTDGSANTSLTASTTGLTLSVFRVGASSVSIASLSNKAADNTAHADGAIRNVGGNLYTIDLPDAACATQVPSICVRGSYTGGVIEGLEHPIVAYDPSVVAVGANTTTPPTASANATAVRSELTTELGRLDVATSTRLASASYSAPPSAATVADAVWDEAYAGHTTAGSFGKLMDILRKSNLTIEGTVSNAITPTTLTFSSNVSATTSAYAHAVLLFVSGPLAGENSPIISYTNANGVFVLEEPLTAAPSDGDEFVVIAGSHVHAIADIAAGVLSYIGTGARTVTITVDDGTNPLENAIVRMTNGAETLALSTNASGVAVFNLDDATWTVSISKPGYSFAGASLVVDGTETVTYSMSLVVITPSSVDKVTGYWTVLDETGSAAASVVVTIKARQPLRGGAGIIHDAGERTATSNGSGLVQFTNLIPGWRYAVVANDDYVADFVVPADAVTSVELGSIVARLP